MVAVTSLSKEEEMEGAAGNGKGQKTEESALIIERD